MPKRLEEMKTAELAAEYDLAEAAVLFAPVLTTRQKNRLVRAGEVLGLRIAGAGEHRVLLHNGVVYRPVPTGVNRIVPLTADEVDEAIGPPDHQGGPADELRKVRAAVADGRVVVEPETGEAIRRMNPDDPDFTLASVTLDFWGPFTRDDGSGNRGGLDAHWTSVSAGCGRVVVYKGLDGALRCESQGMGREFVKGVLSALVDGMAWDDGPESHTTSKGQPCAPSSPGENS